MKTFCLSFFCFFVFNSYAQKQESFISLSDSAKYFVEQLSMKNSFMSEIVGYAGETPDQWKNYQGLLRHTSDQTLDILTKHQNPAVRCYSFLGLMKRNKKTRRNFERVLEHIQDTSRIFTLEGCIGEFKRVGDIFIQSYDYSYTFGKEVRSPEADELNYILFYIDNFLLHKCRAINSMAPSEKVYNRLID